MPSHRRLRPPPRPRLPARGPVGFDLTRELLGPEATTDSRSRRCRQGTCSRNGKLAALNSIGITGVNVFGLYQAGTNTDLEVRSFAPGDGVPEDPVCGSGNGCVAALVRRDGILNARSYVASQGRCLGRDGLVSVQFDTGTIWLGGHAVTCVEGSLQP